nr:radical SAM protein [Ruminococcus flavefaciens]
MIDRACISINNRCNLNCSYCHFHTAEKAVYLAGKEMNVFSILDNIMQHINKYDIEVFKLGFVGNGEPLLDYEALHEYIKYISDYLSANRIAAYTITNGTLITEKMLDFFKENKVNVGFSIDGIPEIHNQLRCNTHSEVMKAIELYHSVNGYYPSMNCTIGRDVLKKAEDTIAFFEPFGSRITFSRMIGAGGISLDQFHCFLDKAKQRLNVRTGGYDSVINVVKKIKMGLSFVLHVVQT